MKLNFFDCNVQIGRGKVPVKETPEFYGNVETLIKEMDYFGIEAGLIYHRIAREGNNHLGNKILMKKIKGYANLHPCWVLSPQGIRNEGEAGKLLQEMKQQGVRAVRLFPGSEYPLTGWMCGYLFKTLEKEKVPVFFPSIAAIDSSKATALERLNKLCKSYPELAVIMGGWGIPQEIFPLLAIHKGLYLDISLFSGHENIEYICQHYGSDRLLFGTRFGQSPFSCAGAPVTVVTMANISEDDKRKIAGDNLRRLLKMPPAEKRTRKSYSSPFIIPLREGQPIKSEIIVDAHAHNALEKDVIPKKGPKGMVEVMDRLGIDIACISTLQRVSIDVRVTNDLCVEAVNAHPERFIGYTVVDPHYPDQIKRELELRYRQANIKNLKVHPFHQNYPLTGPNYMPAWEFALQHKSVVLCHSTVGHPMCTPGMFDKLAEKYPEIPFIIGHAGNDRDGYKEAIEVARKRKNIYLDTSGWCMTSLGVLEYVVNEIGAERILFGTDFVLIGVPFALGAIAYAKISDEDKRKIMGLNAVKLFDIKIQEDISHEN